MGFLTRLQLTENNVYLISQTIKVTSVFYHFVSKAKAKGKAEHLL